MLAQDGVTQTRQELAAVEQLIDLLHLREHFSGSYEMHGCDPIIRSPHKLAEAGAAAVLVESIAAAAIWCRMRNGQNKLQVSAVDSLHALHSTHFLSQWKYPISVGAEYIPTNGLYKCADGRYVMTESGPPYRKLETGYLNFLNCGNNREAIAKAIIKYEAEELQTSLSDLGLPASIAYTKDEWRSHAQGRALLDAPVVEVVKVGDAPPKPFSVGASEPVLSGVRVLDFTHVLAGPRSARTLAQYGADVLHITSPYHLDTLPQNLLVNMGKRNAYLNLEDALDLQTMRTLLQQADVFTNSYRPSVARRFGLDPDAAFASNPNLIYLSVNAYGHSGPWHERPGFDQNGQVATGVAWSEGEAHAQPGADVLPMFTPVFYLNDFLTGYLAAAGMMSALLRRSIEGGAYHVKLSLARTAMWVQDLGYVAREQYAKCPEKDEYPAELSVVGTTYGDITELAPAVKFDQNIRIQLNQLKPFGADKPTWT